MLFSKSKNESDPEDRTLFDMRKIGKRISELRRTKDITQTTLADMMGISFQAVSNWERGESMPDISKLGDLSRIFGVSIDEILCNPRAAKIVGEISAGEKPDDMTAEELAETAPIMTPAQAQENIEENLDKITLAQLAELAPFVSSEALAVIAHKCVDNGCSVAEIAAVAPFMEEDDLGRLALEKLGSGCTLSDLPAIAPFMDKDDLSKIAEKVCKNGCSAKELVAVAPLWTRRRSERLLLKCLTANGRLPILHCFIRLWMKTTSKRYFRKSSANDTPSLTLPGYLTGTKYTR